MCGKRDSPLCRPSKPPSLSQRFFYVKKMRNKTHTSGLLFAYGHQIVTKDEDELRIATCINLDVGTVQGKENASRIAACWNACDGISTAYLEMGIVAANDIRHNGVDATPALISIERDVFKTRGERLLKCLSKLTDAARTSGGVSGKDRDLCLACDEAESLIAEIRRFEESLMVEGVDYEPQDINIHSEQMR